MKLHLLDCGSIDIPCFNIIQNERALKEPGLLFPAPVEAFLIECADGLILFDTGCDPQGIAGNWPELYRGIPYRGHYLPERLKEIGVAPKEIKTVVASHLHFDHAGCLHLFKNARVYVNETEFNTTMHAYDNGLDMDNHLPSDVRNWRDAGLAWEMVSTPEVRLAQGVTIVNFGSGHAWGMLGLLVELPRSGSVLLAGDTIYTRANLGPPQILPGLLHDKGGYLRTVSFVESYAARRHAKLLYGHDPEQFGELLKQTGGIME